MTRAFSFLLNQQNWNIFSSEMTFFKTCFQNDKVKLKYKRFEDFTDF